MQAKYKGYEKLAFFDQYVDLFRNGKRNGHSDNGRRIGTRMRSNDGAISNDLESPYFERQITRKWCKIEQ